jgi:hypothetical protein
MEQFHKEFELTDFQRQLRDWASRCCGADILGWGKLLKAARRPDPRLIRQQIAQELAELDAASVKR